MGVFFADPPPRPPPPIRLEKARSFRRMKTQAPAFGDDEGREVFGGPRQESPMSGAQRALRRLSTMGAAQDADDAVNARESEASVRASLCERMASRVADSLREPSPGLGASDAHAELRHVFDAIAEGGDSITEREFVGLAAVLRLNLSPAECRRVWRQVDLQRTGAVSFAAFERAVRRRRLLRRIVAAYVDERCDRDGDANAFAVPAGYDYDGSTRDNYLVDAPPAVDASPAVAAARALVDAGYHGHYAAAREKWQNGIVESIAVRTEPQRRPWVVFTCGPMGAGKGHALSWLSEHGFFPLENIVQNLDLADSTCACALTYIEVLCLSAPGLYQILEYFPNELKAAKVASAFYTVKSQLVRMAREAREASQQGSRATSTFDRLFFNANVSVSNKQGSTRERNSQLSYFKGSYLGRFPLVLADFWTSDHLSERSRRVDVFFVTRARGTLTLKRR